jgi:hypothetical protein
MLLHDEFDRACPCAAEDDLDIDCALFGRHDAQSTGLLDVDDAPVLVGQPVVEKLFWSILLPHPIIGGITDRTADALLGRLFPMPVGIFDDECRLWGCSNVGFSQYWKFGFGFSTRCRVFSGFCSSSSFDFDVCAL